MNFFGNRLASCQAKPRLDSCLANQVYVFTEKKIDFPCLCFCQMLNMLSQISVMLIVSAKGYRCCEQDRCFGLESHNLQLSIHLKQNPTKASLKTFLPV